MSAFINAPITAFRGKHGFLSNFAPCEVFLYGEACPTVEHAYQAAKTLDVREQEMIFNAPTPSAVKRLGRRVTLRKDWEEQKLPTMARLLAQKFAPDTAHSKQLINTGNTLLVESNHWGDNFWGQSPLNTGHNHLGVMLMTIRAFLQENYK